MLCDFSGGQDTSVLGSVLCDSSGVGEAMRLDLVMKFVLCDPSGVRKVMSLEHVLF